MKDRSDETKNSTWVLVADASRAQLYETDKTLEVFSPIEASEHPVPASADGNTNSDDGMTDISLERHADPHQTTADTFARDLGRVINAGRIAHRFDHLIVVASPAFLGALRRHIDTESSRLVLASIAHDWTSVPLHELPARVRSGMPPPADV